MKALALLIAVAMPLSAQAAETGDLVRFIACPVYRDADSGKKSGCWLADDPQTGARWDVSLSPHKPDWNFAVLVEGRVSAGKPDVCGARVLDAVRTSRLYDQPCTQHMLPAEGYPGRRYKLNGRYIDPVSVPRQAPAGPFGPRTFPVYFEFGSDFLIYQYDDFLIDRAETWLKAAKPKRVVVTGYAMTTPAQVSGQAIAEPAVLARTRAEAVSETLRRLLPGLAIETRWRGGAEPTQDADADGLPWQSQRRVEISAEF